MKRVAALTVLALLATTPVAALAQVDPDNGRPSYGAGRGDQDEARAAVKGGRHLPLAQVIAQIAARTPGRQLNTTMGDYSGRPAYFVQWQTHDNHVIIFIIDAQTGQQLGRQGG